MAESYPVRWNMVCFVSLCPNLLKKHLIDVPITSLLPQLALLSIGDLQELDRLLADSVGQGATWGRER